ncbi:MAG: WD40/YVTN/BNR-like repeat-containing protein [Bacteroidota bacterium]
MKNVFFIFFFGLIYIETNAQWYFNYKASSNIEFIDISIPNSDTVFVCGYNQLLNKSFSFKSVDNGLTWDSILISNCRINSVCFSSVQKGFALGNDSILYGTSDGGQIWATVSFFLKNLTMY